MEQDQRKQQQQDHDTLIRIEGMVTRLVSDMKEMKDGISTKIADHEIRIVAAHTRLDGIDVEIKLFKQRVKDYWKIIVVLGAFVGTVFGYFLNKYGDKLPF